MRQIQQLQAAGKEFEMQHAEIEEMDRALEEFVENFIHTIPIERRLQGLSPEERQRLRELLNQEPQPATRKRKKR